MEPTMTMQGAATDGALGLDGRSPRRRGGLFARLGGAVMRRARATVWGLLDLETEFEVLD